MAALKLNCKGIEMFYNLKIWLKCFIFGHKSDDKPHYGDYYNTQLSRNCIVCDKSIWQHKGKWYTLNRFKKGQ